MITTPPETPGAAARRSGKKLMVISMLFRAFLAAGLLPTQVPIEQPVKQEPGELRALGDLLVELEVAVDQVLHLVGRHVVEGQARVP